jgi:hypothetical protein
VSKPAGPWPHKKDEDDRRVITLDDGDHGRFYAVWSRSGKRLIVTVWNPLSSEHRQIELLPEQVETLIQYLTETVPRGPADH